MPAPIYVPTTEPDPVTVAFSLASGIVGWRLAHLTLTEALSEPYRAYLTLVATDDDLEPDKLLGDRVTVDLDRGPISRRLHGVIDEISVGDHASSNPAEVSCTVRVVPALALLAQRHGSRIFQDATAAQILELVLAPLADYAATFELRLQQRLSTYEYRTQYDESDLELVQRLVAEEGLFYYFEFEGEVEHLVLADHPSRYLELESTTGSSLRFISVDGMDGDEGVTSLVRTERTQPTTLRLSVFDWTRRDVEIDATSSPLTALEPSGACIGPERAVDEHDVDGLLPHSYDRTTLEYTSDDHERQVGLRRLGHILGAQSFLGSGTAIGAMPGRRFVLLEHPTDVLPCNQFTVVSVSHDLAIDTRTPPANGTSGAASAGAQAAAAAVVGLRQEAGYGNHFMVIPASMAHVAPRRRRRRIAGIVTARVVGPAGQELYTDEHGRVKVQFHWDRTGQRDEHSSCWVRVMQAWAGAGWGTWFLPRVGMEVVIAFIDGDPDRPVVTGTLYNGQHRTPFPLPEEATRSGLRTSSSPFTGGFNELRFEDTAGAEQVYLRAEKDLDELVKHHHTTHVLANQANTVDGMHTVTVGQDRTVAVGGSETITIGAARTETVTGAETIRLLDLRDTDITRSDRLVVHETREEEIEGAFDGRYLGGRTVIVEQGDVETVEGSDKSVTVHGEYGIEVDESFRVKRQDTELFMEDEFEATSPSRIFLVVGGNHVELESGGMVTVTAASELVLQCGNSKVSLRSDGSIELSGTSRIDMVVGATTVETTTSGHAITGTQVDVTGNGQVSITGAMVKIN